ncbi:unnamed protein product [Allacma fusca]|uniref:Lipase domain-containing protein n=1 Tax=Allacma fusca TaxID=39272 RepID=A0A8J2JPQ3_9HEXA|nr:unnamed protein product [Allacma fusca]
MKLLFFVYLVNLSVTSIVLAQDIPNWLEFETNYARSKAKNITANWGNSEWLMEEILTGGDVNQKSKMVRLYLYPSTLNKFYSEEIVIDDFESLVTSNFNRNLPTKIFIHGFGHGYNCSFPQDMKDIFLLYQIPVNLVVVEWGPLAMSSEAPSLIDRFKNYIVASENVEIVGNRVGDFISYMWMLGYYSPSMVHIIGFSLGAHAAGYAGKRVYDSTLQQIGRITGLDPAGPLYSTGLVGRHLNEYDASYVDFVHTDMGQSGTVLSLGHSNYFVNGGKPKQPGCISQITEYSLFEKIPVALLGSCSHSTAPLYYSQSVAQSNDFIVATQCYSNVAFQTGLCAFNDVAIFGEFSSPRTRGWYYLRMLPQDRSNIYSC